MPRMDRKIIQPSIDALNAEIQRCISARDILLELVGSGAAKEKPTANARSIAQRKRWAEQKRRQREAAKKGKK